MHPRPGCYVSWHFLPRSRSHKTQLPSGPPVPRALCAPARATLLLRCTQGHQRQPRPPAHPHPHAPRRCWSWCRALPRAGAPSDCAPSLRCVSCTRRRRRQRSSSCPTYGRSRRGRPTAGCCSGAATEGPGARGGGGGRVAQPGCGASVRRLYGRPASQSACPVAVRRAAQGHERAAAAGAAGGRRQRRAAGPPGGPSRRAWTRLSSEARHAAVQRFPPPAPRRRGAERSALALAGGPTDPVCSHACRHAIHPPAARRHLVGPAACTTCRCRWHLCGQTTATTRATPTPAAAATCRPWGRRALLARERAHAALHGLRVCVHPAASCPRNGCVGLLRCKAAAATRLHPCVL